MGGWRRNEGGGGVSIFFWRTIGGGLKFPHGSCRDNTPVYRLFHSRIVLGKKLFLKTGPVEACWM